MENKTPCTAENVLQSVGAIDAADGGGSDEGADDDDFRRTHKNLLQENQILRGKLRGYQTLTNLFQESKCDLHTVQQEKKLLQSQLDELVSRQLRNEGGQSTSHFEKETQISTESQNYTSAISNSGQLTQSTDPAGETDDMKAPSAPVEHQTPSAGDGVSSTASPSDVHAFSENVTFLDEIEPRLKQIHVALSDQTLSQSGRKTLSNQETQQAIDAIDAKVLERNLVHLYESTSSEQTSQLRETTAPEQQTEVCGINKIPSPYITSQSALLPSSHQLGSLETLTIRTHANQARQNFITTEDTRYDKTVNIGSEEINTNETIHQKLNSPMKNIPIRDTYRQCSEPSHGPGDTTASLTQEKRIKSSSESHVNKVGQQLTEMFTPQITTESTGIALNMSTELSRFPDLTQDANLNKSSEHPGIVNIQSSSGNRYAPIAEGGTRFSQSAIDPGLFAKESSFRGLPISHNEDDLLSLGAKEAMAPYKNPVRSGWLDYRHPEQLVSEGMDRVSEDDNSFMSRFVIVTSELEKMARSEQMRKTLVETLRTENRQLRAKLMAVSNEKETQAIQSRQEVGMLLAKIKRVEHERDAMLSRSTSPGSDRQTSWVKVDLQTHSEKGAGGGVTQESYSQLISELHRFQEENNKLMQARQTLEGNARYKVRLDTLQHQLDIKDRQMKEANALDEARMKDIDHMLMNMKSDYYKLEHEYEECNNHLDEANSRIVSLEAVIQDLREQNRQLKQSKEHRVDRHKQQTKRSDAVPVKDQTQIMLEELTNDKEALKQQLLVYQEDYQKERHDRARAHSLKEEMRKKIDFLKERLKAVEQQKRHSDESRQTLEIETVRLEQQLHNAEDTVQKTLDENESLQRQVKDLQNMVASKANQASNSNKQIPAAAAFVFPQAKRWQRPPAQTSPQRPAAAHPNYELTAPELLPGAWQCYQCSFINYPGRNVCEICGFVTISRDVPDSTSPLQEAEAPPQNLVARSDYLTNTEFNTRAWSDITTDGQTARSSSAQVEAKKS